MEKDEMMMHHHCMGGKHMYMLLGTLAFLWGLMNYFIVVLNWPSYAAWMVVGILLVLIGWAKKWMYMMMYMKK